MFEMFASAVAALLFMIWMILRGRRRHREAAARLAKIVAVTGRSGEHAPTVC